MMVMWTLDDIAIVISVRMGTWHVPLVFCLLLPLQAVVACRVTAWLCHYDRL